MNESIHNSELPAWVLCGSDIAYGTRVTTYRARLKLVLRAFIGQVGRLKYYGEDGKVYGKGWLEYKTGTPYITWWKPVYRSNE